MKKLFTLLFVFLTALSASAEEITFDFENNNGNWPVGEGANFADGNLTQPLVVDGVSLTGIQGDATQPCRLMKDNSGITALYVYKLGSIKFNAPEGKALTTIAVTMKSGTFDLTANNGAVADNAWTGNATEVVFNHANSGNRQMLKIVVTIADENGETVKPGAVTYDTEVADIAAFNAIEDGKVAKLTLTNARVNGVKGSNYYVEDATGATVIKGVELTAATALNGYIIGTKATDVSVDMNNVMVEHQLSATDATTFEATTTTLAGTVMTASEAAVQANYGRLITLENVSISGSGKNKTLKDADGNELAIKARDYMGVLPTDYVWPEAASKITGILIYYITGWFLMPISADAIVAAGVQPTEVTFAFNESLHKVGTKLTDPEGFIFNETFTVDNVALQVTAGSAQSAIYADNSRGTCLAMFPMYAMMGITAPEGYAVTKIEFTQAGAGDLNMTPMVGTVEDHTWTGNADVVYFTMPQKQGTAYLAKATITLAEKNAETVTAQIDYTECANIAEFNALEDGTPAKLTLTNAEVIGISANGYGTAWIQDATGGCMAQYTSIIGSLQEKTRINAVFYTIVRKNSGNAQMKEAIHSQDGSIAIEYINEYTTAEGTLAEVNVAANKNKVVKISGATLTMTSATAGTLTQGDATIDVNNGNETANQQLHKIENWTKDTTLENITIVAILTGKSDTVNQLLPISITEGTNGISNVNAADVKGLQIYNLQGIRLNSVQKGLNIVNGKKVVIK